jgi:hypothetical protein
MVPSLPAPSASPPARCRLAKVSQSEEQSAHMHLETAVKCFSPLSAPGSRR